MTAEEIAAKLGGARRLAEGGWSALCPAHDDHNPSLSLADGKDGKLLVRCHAGCEQFAVWEALRSRGLLNGHGVDRDDDRVAVPPRASKRPELRLGPPPKEAPIPRMIDPRLGKPSASWAYRDAAGDLMFYVARYDTEDGKQLKPWSWDLGTKAWVCKSYPRPRPLYGLDRLARAPNASVLIVEGEKCADVAVALGYVVMTWPGGSSAVSAADWSPLSGREITVWPDADDVGRKAAEAIAAIVGQCTVLDVADRPNGWDVADAVAEGWTPDHLQTFIEERRSPAASEAKPTNPPFSLDISEIVGLYRTPDPVYGVAIQRGRVHALTSPTNHGKTAVVTTIIPAVALGLRLGVDDVQEGNVLALVGENPEDFYGRLLATLGEFQIAIEKLKGRVRIVPHAFPLISRIDEVRAEAKKLGDIILVVVDTNASYYGYEDEIDNVQQRQQAADLRELTRLPGNPAVLATCHPVKSASRDNLMPRGGGGFLNEIDTNLTVWKEDDIAAFHYQHKIRGPGFEPIKFALKMCPVPGQVDAKGRRPQTVVAVPLTDSQAEIIEHKAIQDENRLLAEVFKNDRDSIATWAEHLGWVTPSGNPHKSKVHRMLVALERSKLVKKVRGGKYEVTTDGKKVLEGVL